MVKITEKLIKMDDLGGFTPIFGNTQILMKHEVIYSSDWIRWSDRLEVPAVLWCAGVEFRECSGFNNGRLVPG